MSDHPKIVALEQLISERRMIKAKELLKDIDKDLMRLDELEKKFSESRKFLANVIRKIDELDNQLKRVSPSQNLPLPKK